MLAVGDRLGPYELFSPLGEGGMGEVWKARDPRLNRSVAIKVSKTAFSDRSEREACAIAAHGEAPAIVPAELKPGYAMSRFLSA
jgi:serine/threonine protein kinase